MDRMDDAEAIRAEIARISGSKIFARSERLLDFLRFTVEESLAARGARLKEYVIGVEVYGRPVDYNPKIDSIVRSEAARLRAKLDEYYASEGKANPVRIRYAKGGYIPSFETARHMEHRPATVAVLPFVNTGAAAEDEYFSDGLTDELIGALARLSNLRVIARTSVFEFKGKSIDVREIGQRLGASAIVEGTVRSFQNRVRVTAQLIDVDTGAHLCAERYERELRDIFAIQDELTHALAASLSSELSPRRAGNAPDPEAHRLYLKGRYYFHRWALEEVRKSISYFEQATVRDPSYAPGWIGLGDSHNILAYWDINAEENFAAAERALLRALELDPQSQEAQTVYAANLAIYRWRWRESEQVFRRLIDRRHSPAYFLFAIACLTPLGRLQEAALLLRQGLELDPLYLGGQVHLGRVLYLSGEYEEAIAQLESTLELDPRFREAHWQLGLTYEAKCDFEQAMASFGRALALSGDSPGAWGSLGHCCAICGRISEARRYLELLRQFEDQQAALPALALIHLGLGETGEALRCIEQCCSARSSMVLRLTTDPRLAPLRDEPRFVDILTKIGITQRVLTPS